MFTFKGRMGRLDFFARGILLSALQFGLNFIFQSILKNMNPFDPNYRSIVLLSSLVTIVVSVLVIVGVFSITIRRWHDLGFSGWFSLLNFVPLLNFFVGLYLLFKKGDAAANKYGAPTV